MPGHSGRLTLFHLSCCWGLQSSLNSSKMVRLGLKRHSPRLGRRCTTAFVCTCPRASQLWAQEGPGKSLEFTHHTLPMKNDLRSSWEKCMNKPTNTNKAIAPIRYQQPANSSPATLRRSQPAVPSLSRLNLDSIGGQCRGTHCVYRGQGFLIILIFHCC